MDILKNNRDTQLQYVISLFNFSCNTNITKKQIKNHIQYLQKMRNNTNFLINYENLSSPATLISKTKVQKIPKVQMEHFQDLIVDPNITHKKKKEKI